MQRKENTWPACHVCTHVRLKSHEVKPVTDVTWRLPQAWHKALPATALGVASGPAGAGHLPGAYRLGVGAVQAHQSPGPECQTERTAPTAIEG
jgi:hypothetical protein